jgi:hypothetical protein
MPLRPLKIEHRQKPKQLHRSNSFGYPIAPVRKVMQHQNLLAEIGQIFT